MEHRGENILALWCRLRQKDVEKESQVETGPTDPPPRRAACGYIRWGPRRVRAEAGPGASAARSEVALHQTFRAGWRIGGMGTWIDQWTE
jgi:hypothetical protein